MWFISNLLSRLAEQSMVLHANTIVAESTTPLEAIYRFKAAVANNEIRHPAFFSDLVAHGCREKFGDDATDRAVRQYEINLAKESFKPTE